MGTTAGSLAAAPRRALIGSAAALGLAALALHALAARRRARRSEGRAAARGEEGAPGTCSEERLAHQRGAEDAGLAALTLAVSLSLPYLRVPELLRCCQAAPGWRSEVESWRDEHASEAGASATAIHAVLDAADPSAPDLAHKRGTSSSSDVLERDRGLAEDVFELGWRAPRLLRSRDCAGRPPLLRAAQLGATPLVAALLRARADVAARGGHGWTALHAAAACGHAAACGALLTARADADARSSDGLAPLFYAHRCDGGGGEAVAQLLLQAGARPCCRADRYGFTDTGA